MKLPPLTPNLRAFVEEYDREAEALLADVADEFGDHPVGWPVPPRSVPRWYQFWERRRFRNLATWFGGLSQDDLDAFWAESDKGQSVYEDAGGYMLRCYRALVALPVEKPYTYAHATADLLDAGRKALENTP